jgi:hypothetical protein
VVVVSWIWVTYHVQAVKSGLQGNASGQAVVDPRTEDNLVGVIHEGPQLLNWRHGACLSGHLENLPLTYDATFAAMALSK